MSTIVSVKPYAARSGGPLSDGRLYSEPLALVLLSLLALALRLAFLGRQPLWWDEGYSIYFAAQDLVTLTLKTAADIHPPLYYYLLHLWIRVAGPGPEAARLLSAFTGVLIVPALYAVARPCAGRRGALIAAALAACSPMQIYYSQEVRMYALVTLLALGSVYFAQRILLPLGNEQGHSARPASGADWLGYTVTTTLAMYALYYAAFIPLFQSLYVLAKWRQNRRLVSRWFATQLAVAALFAPWVWLAGDILVNYVGAKMVVEARTAVGLGSYLWDHVTAFSVGHALGEWRWLSATAIPAAGLALVGTLVPGPFRASVPWLLCWLGIPVAAGFALNLVYPFSPAGYQRFLLYAQPAVLILVALGLDWLLGRASSLARLARWSSAALAAVFAAGTVLPLAPYFATPRYAADDYRPLISQIAALGHPADAVLCVFPWQVGYLESYLPDPKSRPEIVEAPEAAWSRDDGTLARDLDALLSTSRRVWFPAHQKHGAILEKRIESRLSTSGYPATNDWFGDTRLYMFSPGSPAASRAERLTFGRALALASASVGSQPAEVGLGVVPVELRWRLNAPLAGDYAVKLRLADAAGRTWGQRDSAPAAAQRPFATWQPQEEVIDRHGLLIPAGTPPGTYRLLLSVYSRETSEALNIEDANGKALGPEASLGEIVVARSAYRPPTAALRMQGEAGAEYAGGLRLLGYSAPAGPQRPGDRLNVSLFWLGGAGRAQPYIVFVQIQDPSGKPWTLAETPDLGNGFSLAGLDPDESMRSQYELRLPATTPDGEYRLVAGLLSPVGMARLPSSKGDQVTLADVTVRGRQHTAVVPPMQRTVGARFGDAAELLGYDLVPDQTGRGASVTLYWRPAREFTTSYSVFLHLVDAGGAIWGQRDSLPQSGKAPTTSWLPGEVIADTYALQARSDAPAGGYRVVAGMYVEGGGPRLPVTAGGTGQADSLTLAFLEVKP